LDLPTVDRASLIETGAPISVVWQMRPDLAVNQLPSGVKFGERPQGAIRSTWNGSDANIAEITSNVFDAPQNDCLVLPVLSGPRTAGISYELEDADSGRAITSVPFLDDQIQWTYWRVQLDPAIKHLRIVARDQGQDWGEWVAAGTPAPCR
jgi:hypothetical protein